MPTLGEELKRLREEKGLTVRDVSDATHIGGRFLQAIESDNYSILPGGIFNRGFVRSYARYVGLDEEQALMLYGQQLEAQGGDPPMSAAPSLEGIEEEASSPWGSIALIVIILILLSAGIYTAYRWFKGSAIANDIVSTSPAPTVDASAAPTTTPLPTTETSSSPVPGLAAEVSPPVTASPSPSAATQAVPSTATPIEGPLQVKIQVGDSPCWLKVKTDANPAAMGTLNPGDVREFSASEKMVLNLGNAVGVNVTLNGRPMKLPIKGVMANVILTKDNYQQFLQ